MGTGSPRHKRVVGNPSVGHLSSSLDSQTSPHSASSACKYVVAGQVGIPERLVSSSPRAPGTTHNFVININVDYFSTILSIFSLLLPSLFFHHLEKQFFTEKRGGQLTVLKICHYTACTSKLWPAVWKKHIIKWKKFFHVWMEKCMIIFEDIISNDCLQACIKK